MRKFRPQGTDQWRWHYLSRFREFQPTGTALAICKSMSRCDGLAEPSLSRSVLMLIASRMPYLQNLEPFNRLSSSLGRRDLG